VKRVYNFYILQALEKNKAMCLRRVYVTAYIINYCRIGRSSGEVQGHCSSWHKRLQNGATHIVIASSFVFLY
jgi:hypothetical protein